MVRVRRRRLALLAGIVLVAVAVALLTRGSPSGPTGSVPAIPTLPGAPHGKTVADPLAWTPARSADFARRAAAGTSHLLYVRSPGGVALSAERTLRFRKPIERVARRVGVSPDRLEALVFLESAGRPDALAPGGIDGAAGLTQILAETARDLLGLHVDSAASARYTARIDKAIAHFRFKRAARLSRARARVDERFDPAKAIAATGRYLALAKRRFGREDLAFVSYHMGIGNLQRVLGAYGAGNVPYARLYFDSTPLRHAAAYRLLSGFGDDSSNYFWKLGAAEQILRLARTDHAALIRQSTLQTGADDARLVLHPPGSAPGDGLEPLPDRPRDTGLRAPRGAKLRPEALAAALYIGAVVKAIAHARPLRVVGVADPPRGWGFAISRTYASRRQALAFQYVLDRLQVLNVIAWSRSARAIHVAAGARAAALEPLLARIR
jgi:transglycosylase-like protein with SLT domain